MQYSATTDDWRYQHIATANLAIRALVDPAELPAVIAELGDVVKSAQHGVTHPRRLDTIAVVTALTCLKCSLGGYGSPLTTVHAGGSPTSLREPPSHDHS